MIGSEETGRRGHRWTLTPPGGPWWHYDAMGHMVSFEFEPEGPYWVWHSFDRRRS